MASYLPNELTAHIIQDLHSEPETLANCALVCRAWAPTAQRILLSKIAVHERNCTEIVQYLVSPTPNTILGYVKRLYVYLWGDLRVNLNRSTANLTPLLHLLLPHISRFHNVTELVFDGCRAFHDLHWDEIWTDLLATAFPSVSGLTVQYLKFEDLPDLVDLVSCFPQLTQLTGDDLDVAEASHEFMNEEQKPYEGTKTPPPLLESITYCSGQSFASGGGPFLRWLAAGPQAFTALHLDLDAEAGDVNAGVELVRAANNTLRTLSLSFSDQWHMWEEALEFSANSSLRSLVLRSVSDFGSSLVGILGSVASPMEYLTLGNVQEMDEEIWPGLVEVLMSRSFPSLVEVNFLADSEDGAEELRTDISNEYPEFAARGIAVFGCKLHHEW
ncbi:hypothetical protein DFH06DRAFT_42973 [Mycena polygramma]|nr:hypothetical protein DFH06DRAFT_42973 [Mycena polygramma]